MPSSLVNSLGCLLNVQISGLYPRPIECEKPREVAKFINF